MLKKLDKQLVRLMPGFLKRLDHWMLLHTPVLWSSRVHIVPMLTLAFSAIVLSIIGATPVSFNGLIDASWLMIIGGLVGGIGLIWWYVKQANYDTRLNFGKARWMDDLRHTVIYMVVTACFFWMAFGPYILYELRVSGIYTETEWLKELSGAEMKYKVSNHQQYLSGFSSVAYTWEQNQQYGYDSYYAEPYSSEYIEQELGYYEDELRAMDPPMSDSAIQANIAAYRIEMESYGVATQQSSGTNNPNNLFEFTLSNWKSANYSSEELIELGDFVHPITEARHGIFEVKQTEIDQEYWDSNYNPHTIVVQWQPEFFITLANYVELMRIEHFANQFFELDSVPMEKLAGLELDVVKQKLFVEKVGILQSSAMLGSVDQEGIWITGLFCFAIAYYLLLIISVVNLFSLKSMLIGTVLSLVLLGFLAIVTEIASTAGFAPEVVFAVLGIVITIPIQIGLFSRTRQSASAVVQWQVVSYVLPASVFMLFADWADTIAGNQTGMITVKVVVIGLLLFALVFAPFQRHFLYKLFTLPK